MKKIFFACAVFFPFLVTAAFAQNFKGHTPEPIEIAAPQKSLPIGEKLQYQIEWLGIPIGNMNVEIVGIEKIDGQECYHIKGAIMPNRFFKKLYDLEYKVHAYFDAHTLASRRFQKNKRIRGSQVYIDTEFDQNKHEATFSYSAPGGSVEVIDFLSLRKKVFETRSATIRIPNNSLDLFSSVYCFRLMPVREKEPFVLNIAYEQKTYPMRVTIDKLYRKEIYRKGSFSVMEVTPDSDLNDAMLGKRKITAIFTTDFRRIPLEFRLHAKVGLIRGILKEIPRE